MSHVRQQIRDYVAGKLEQSIYNVYTSRVYPLTGAKLPGILVFVQSESSSELSFNSPVQVRTLRVVVQGYVRALADFDAELDDMAVDIEQRILESRTLEGIAHNIELTETEHDYSGDGEQPVATVMLNFTVQYRTQTGSPETAI